MEDLAVLGAVLAPVLVPLGGSMRVARQLERAVLGSPYPVELLRLLECATPAEPAEPHRGAGGGDPAPADGSGARSAGCARAGTGC